MSTEFKFRSKFKEFVKTDESRTFWENTFQKFLNCNEEEAKELLILFFFYENGDQKSCPEIFKACEKHLPEMPKKADTFCLLRNELVSQYKNHKCKDFLVSKKNPEWFSIFSNTDLFHASKGSIGDACTTELFDKCYDFITTNTSDELKRTRYLLNNSAEEFYFGGMRSLGLDKDLAKALKPHIGLVSGIYNYLFDKISNCQNEVVLQNVIEDTKPTVQVTNADILNSKNVPTSYTNSPLTVEFIVQNFDMFQALISHPYLFALLEKISIPSQEVLDILDKYSSSLMNCGEVISFVRNNYDVLKGKSQQDIESAIKKANDPTALRNALVSLMSKS